MKKFLGTIALLLIVFTAVAQNNLNGIVTNKNNELLKGATITINTKNFKTKIQTGEKGQFSLSNLDANLIYKISVEFVGLKTFDTTVHLQKDVLLNIVLQESNASLEPLEVSSIRASDKAPFTKTNISKTDIAKK